MITIELKTKEEIKFNIPLSFDEACTFYYGYVICGIYKITNTINNRCYIGQSINIRKRWIGHKNSKCDYPLYRAFKKYGIENFTFEILEECKKEDLDKREEYYIKIFDAYNHGYNQTLLCIGGGHPNIFTQDKLDDLINDLMHTNLSKHELANKYNCSDRTIRDINSGRCWKSDDIEYPIRQFNKPKESSLCCICGKPISSRESLMCYDCMHKSQRKVKDRPGKLELAELIVKNGFSAVGRIFGVTDNAIKGWCKDYKIPYKIDDIRNWYFNITNQENPFLIKDNEKEKKKKFNYRSIYKLDILNCDILKRYDKIADAHRDLGIKKGSHITEACQGKIKSAYGFKWCYVEEYFDKFPNKKECKI